MAEPSIIFNEVNERQGVFTRRIFLMGGVSGVGIGALTGRLAQLQLLQTGDYRKLAEENQFNKNLIVPPRGVISDRNGVPLASNRPNFRLYVTRDSVKDIDATLNAVGQLIPLTDSTRSRVKRELTQGPRFAQVSIAEDLTWEEFSAVTVRQTELPGVTADMGEARVYPYGGAFSHVIGYVAKPNRDDLKDAKSEADALTLHPGFRIGKVGVERAFDPQLRGTPGFQMLEVDHKGRIVGKDPRGDIAPKPGAEVRLTLDADIQARALEVFDVESGSAVMLDCRTGDILCMASAPSFDANRFARGIPSSEYSVLRDYERRPLLDKAIGSTFYPGSTFKPTTALALLAAGVNPEERVHCGGGLGYGGRFFRCWGTHGSQNMHDAIKNSCDTYFYSMCNRAGIDLIADTARKLGYQQTFDIGISGQRKGLIPDTTWVKKARPKDPTWHPGETLSVAIGQILVANALQMAVAVARIANGKKALVPRLVKSVGGVDMPLGSQVPDLPFPAEHMEIVRAGMAAVANDPSGTAYRQSQLGLGDVKMAGKTGTAQVRSYDGAASRSSASVTWKLKDHNLFTAFAPYDNPRYALAVVVEHGGRGGATAGAPRAREIMRIALLKDPEVRARIQKPEAEAPKLNEPAEAEGAYPGDPTSTPAPAAAQPAPIIPAPGGGQI